MKEEFDTSWFDLKKYDKLSELDLMVWYTQLDFRKVILHCGLSKEHIEQLISRIKKEAVIANYDNSSTVNYNCQNLCPFSLAQFVAWRRLAQRSPTTRLRFPPDWFL
jgi:hypothetical protein